MVKVVFSSAIRSSTNGESERALSGAATVGEVLKELVKIYGDKFGQRIMDGGKPRRFVNIYVNGKDIRYLKDVETPVGDADTVDLIPAVSGGSSTHVRGPGERGPYLPTKLVRCAEERRTRRVRASSSLRASSPV